MISSLFFLAACASRAPLSEVEVPLPPVGEGMPALWADVLEAAAEDLDVVTRQEALSLLVLHGSSPEPHASRALYDPSPYVRRKAVDALESRFPEEQSVQLLQDFVLRDDVDPYTRGHAGLILALDGHVEAADVFREASEAAGEWWQAAPLQLAAVEMGVADALEPLQAGLSRGDFPMEMVFFLDCGSSANGALVTSLSQAASRVEEELVLPIATSLVRLGAGEGRALFKERLASKNVETRLEALDFLAELPGGVADSLIEAALRDADSAVSTYARLIRVRRGQEDLEVALSLVGTVDREIHAQALWALEGRLRIENADLGRRLLGQLEEGALAAIEDREFVVAVAGVRLLGVLGTRGARNALQARLAVESAAFRVELVRALLEAR